MKTALMKTLGLSLLLCGAIGAQVVRAQNQVPTPADRPPQPTIPAQPQFDLSFSGGGPRDLVAALEKAIGKPLNVIIAKEYENEEIPAMKFKNVTVPEVFDALRMASQRQLIFGNSIHNTSYSFETQGHGPDAIYYFKKNEPPTPPEAPRFCKFYQLGDDLQTYSIEDITTSIQTAWKMLGIKTPPLLKFHAETKLLIAVGPVDELRTIDDALRELRMRHAPLGADSKKDAPQTK